MGFDATQVLIKSTRMSKRTSYLIVALIILMAALADNWSDDPRAHHQCPDTTHETCDSRCECDGHECPAE